MEIKLTGRMVLPQQNTAPRPCYEATIPIPWRLVPNKADSPVFGGMTWWEVCGRKRSFLSEDDAKSKAWLLALKFEKKGKVFRAYLCPWCEWWHLGHRRKKLGD